MPDTFQLSEWHPAVQVELADGLSEAQLLEFRAFTDWLRTLQNSFNQQKFSDHRFHEEPFSLVRVKIQAFDRFNERIYFMKIFATVENKTGGFVSGVVFLRGGSAAMLMILRPNDKPDERWVIMTEQPRIAAGSLQFMEIPAAILDDPEHRGVCSKADITRSWDQD